MFTNAEISRLLNVADRAVDLAETGHVVRGAMHLQEGLRRARRAKRLGFPGSDELVRRYEYAVARYGEHYGPLALRSSSRPQPGATPAN